MRVHICAVGRLRAGPERELLDDYLRRFGRVGRPYGFNFESILEVEDKKGGGMVAEATLLRKAIPQNAHVIALDERGTLMSSTDFSKNLANLRDDGCSDLAFVIGGADGLSSDLLDLANSKMSLGKLVWPHMLVRVMLSEQLYRAASIIAGSPYHRV